jgi:glyoxylase-like metal-dependent hydrolase (beta-lactamase superfamily II)
MLSRCLQFLLVLMSCLSIMGAANTPEFVLTPVADGANGVYAAIRNEPPGLTFVSNSVFIINEDDVVVVDTGAGPATARALIAALRKLTPKPVRYVINTHWHDDHMLGNAAFREAYPGVEFIGHVNSITEMNTTGATNRKQLLAEGPAFADEIRQALAKGVNLAGKPITVEERLSFQSDLVWAERYFAEAPHTSVIAPTMTLETELRLQRGTREIVVRHLGRAHTAADIVVHLPKENIIITGDLVVWPVPLFGTTSFPVDYVATLEALLLLKPTTIIPGHGPVMRDTTYISKMLAVLRSIEQQVRAAVARGDTREQMRKNTNLASHRDAFAGGSALLGLLFDSYVAGPGVARALMQIGEGR